MITFNEIYEALKKEKFSDSVQLLPRNFLKESQIYFDERKKYIDNENDSFSEIAIKNKKKLENSITSFQDLLRLRKKKILNLAFIASETGISKRDSENLLNFEKELFDSIVKSLEKSNKNKDNEMKQDADSEKKHKLVRFVEEVPAFLDIEGNEIGPFSKGEIANLDNEIVNILSQDNRVELMDE